MKENGRKIKQMEKGFIFMGMELNMKENGLTINKMEMELKFGLIIQNIKASLKWG